MYRLLILFIPLFLYAQQPTDTIRLKMEEVQLAETDSIKSQDTFPTDTLQNMASSLEDDFLELEYPDYENWDAATLEGKLKMRGLPLSPSLKIIMLKDSIINISIRAPFVGEAARIEMTVDSILAVNKMKKTYVKEGIDNFLQYYPGGIGDVQNLLLGRFFLPGVDLAESDLEELVSIYYEDDQFNVIPKSPVEIDGIKYGFVVDRLFNPIMLVILPETDKEIEVSVLYKYNLKGKDIQISYNENGKNLEAVLELKDPEWKAEIPKPIDLEKKYRQMSLKEFISSF